MKTSVVNKESQQKIRYSKCEVCKTRFDMKKLYVVLNKKMCELCGQIQIAQWNNAVDEFNKQFAPNRNVA